jgi:N-acetylglucosaminyldiphosphoundecaprenol N-acetyl-beta-D-mannosaminyltransferase
LYEAAKTDKSVFLFGAKPGTAEAAADNLCKKVEGLKIAGTRNGYFSPEDTDSIINEINESGADILWVCLGAPKQELWMADNKDKLNVSVMMGLGGSLDVYAGNVKRAPKFMIDLKIEWLYRLIKEPYRLGRMLKIPAVLGLAKKEAKRRRKNGRA